MKLTKYIALPLLVVTMLAMAKPALAAEATQEQELIQECKLLCETGAYGQDTTCTNECYQKGTQKQTITLTDGTVIKAHDPINTGLDMSSGMAAMSLAATGVTAIVARRKLVK